ncbi:phage tail repeat domain-containing protein [Shouchella clausii]|uniref:phage tail repeat domain-containing protein n=1 Tax=Shouchella clausii TaxID=79880 RepID=UPI001FE8093B|nr:phage tail repeat domain-containing protein [Shouchella clausii]
MLTDQEVNRINISMPAANAVKLGNILKTLQEATGGDGGEVTVTWADVTGKPSTFPPSAHTHTIAQVDDLQTELDSKLESVAWGDVGNKPSTFPPAPHTHAIADVTGLQAALDDLQAEIDALKGDGGGA